MEIIKLEDRIIYRASKHKKVKFKNQQQLFTEIVVDKERDNIEEVTEENK